MFVWYVSLGTSESAESLKRRGYWDPNRFPVIAATQALNPIDRHVVDSVRQRRGVIRGLEQLWLLSPNEVAAAGVRKVIE